MNEDIAAKVVELGSVSTGRVLATAEEETKGESMVSPATANETP